MKCLQLEEIVKLCEQAIRRENWFDDNECTKKLDEVFSQQAKLMNCVAQYKNHPKEFLGLDMVWWKDERMIAAIEYENTPGTTPINDEWKKLAHVDADYRILISYCTSEERRKEWLKAAGEIIAKNPKNKEKAHYFLILGDQNLWKFRGYEIDKKEQLKTSSDR